MEYFCEYLSVHDLFATDDENNLYQSIKEIYSKGHRSYLLSCPIPHPVKETKSKHLYRETLYRCCNISYTNTIMKKEVI